MALSLNGPGFSWKHNDMHQDETRITDKLFTDAEAGSAGELVKLVNDRWTKASGTDAPGGVLVNNVTAGTDQPCEVVLIRPGDAFVAPYTGTPNAGFQPGANAVAIATDGLSVNAATVAGGPAAVIRINTANETCLVYFKNRQFS